VKENTRAHRANLKLGDAILNVNGKDISHMTLREANRYLANAANAELTLHVSK
jgi:C-terminal processing protease CtpA/Prc